MNNAPDDILAIALTNAELDKFLVGEPFYFFETKDDNDDPQNVVVAFDLLFMPYFRAGDKLFQAAFINSLAKILETYPDRNRAIYMAQRWIWYYRFCISKRNSQPQGVYAALPDIDLTAPSIVLKRQMEVNKTELVNDTRWAGAPWNSKQGLWEPLVRTAVHVRDTLGGPDYVPDNA
ncbi:MULTISPECIES: hypothetical protein [unclassified Pseudomonas]|uniref:hypothetical protein n=1 Tax=unclassified Pseudomonas TaxID=196821 RepID=UPI000D35E7AA|nr:MULTISPECIES: hypothetical protein [unclassified Pseudomonas]RAU47869.1 hypothetical protein DBP26_004740 [Pseudomonas sp. RIT 409]RAU55437.1 hypothetical protein DBY65_005925 [Pseudomonas sp. RIT 412]